MASSVSLIRVIAERLEHYKAANIVVDPVMVATSGAKLIDDSAINELKKSLLPIACVITPNIPEAEVLSSMTISCEEEMVAANLAKGESLEKAVENAKNYRQHRTKPA